MLPRGFKKLIAEANSTIDTLSVHDAANLVGDPNVVLLDVREPGELQQNGVIKGAVHIPRGLLEFAVDSESPMYNQAIQPDKHIVVYCASGGRSALSCKTLREMGFEKVSNLAGGFAAWQEAGGQIERV